MYIILCLKFLFLTNTILSKFTYRITFNQEVYESCFVALNIDIIYTIIIEYIVQKINFEKSGKLRQTTYDIIIVYKKCFLITKTFIVVKIIVSSLHLEYYNLHDKLSIIVDSNLLL